MTEILFFQRRRDRTTMRRHWLIKVSSLLKRRTESPEERGEHRMARDKEAEQKVRETDPRRWKAD